MNISPALLKDLQSILTGYGYFIVNANMNSKQGNHRYIFTDGTIKLLIEFSEYKK